MQVMKELGLDVSWSYTHFTLFKFNTKDSQKPKGALALKIKIRWYDSITHAILKYRHGVAHRLNASLFYLLVINSTKIVKRIIRAIILPTYIQIKIILIVSVNLL